MTAESKPRFLDSLIGLFRDKPGEAPPTNPNKDRDFEAQRANFDAALRDLDEKAEEHRRQRRRILGTRRRPLDGRGTRGRARAIYRRHPSDNRQGNRQHARKARNRREYRPRSSLGVP